MARGFESKAVEEQQQALLMRPAPRPDPGSDPAVAVKRRQLELARTDCLHQLATAHAEPHRAMLRRALAALEKAITELPAL